MTSNRWARAFAKDDGSAVLDFVITAIGGLALTAVALAITVTGFVRVRAIDSLADAARYAMLADSDPAAVTALVAARLAEQSANWPIKLEATELQVKPWAPTAGAGSTASAGSTAAAGGVEVTARFRAIGLEWLGFSEVVHAHAASENN